MSARGAVMSVRNHQRAWARANGVSFDRQGYCSVVDHNIVLGLSAAARREFAEGDGGELGIDGARGKLQALHSSSALACNFFDYWRTRDAAPLAAALGLRMPIQDDSVALERKFRTGVGSRANLDAVMLLLDGTTVAIESKFLEPYCQKKAGLKEAYFKPAEVKRWTNANLPNCQRIAEDLAAGSLKFEYLDAAQLLKHMLALGNRSGAWLLIYLWYQVPELSGSEHQDEITRFAKLLGTDQNCFRAITYQAAFAKLSAAAGREDEPYVAYLRTRYFGAPVA